MNEHQRMHYMEAMGIDMFVPRVHLPHALASRPLSFAAVDELVPSPAQASVAGLIGEEAVGDVLLETQKDAATPAPHTAVTEASVERILGKSASLSLVPDTKPLVEGSASISAVDAPAERFSLEIWQLPEYLVLDSHAAGSGLPTAALLHNLLRHLVYTLSVLPESELIHWPMVDLPNKPKHLSAAREMMGPLLEAKLTQSKQLLLFGEDVFRVIASDADLARGFTEACYTTITIDDGKRALVLPSLSALLHEPLRKKGVWQALQLLTPQM